MQSVLEAPHENQAANSPDNQEKPHSKPRVGIEIVSSAALSSRFFHGPKRISGRPFAASNSDDDWARRISRAMAQ